MKSARGSSDMKQVFGVEGELLAWVSSLSGLGGVAYHLWNGGKIGIKRFIGAVMLSAICGALVYLWLTEDMTSSTKLAAVSVFSGIGATTLIDVVVATAQRYGPEWVRAAIDRRFR